MTKFIDPGSVAHDLLVLSIVIATGLGIGGVRVRGIRLGIVGVLFTGILSAHYGANIDEKVLFFLRDAALALFVYSVGLEVGPSFVASLQNQGLHLNLLAGAVVAMGGAMTAGIIIFKLADMPLAVGLLTGATTSTPSLAAAQQSLSSLPDLTRQASKLPALGYAVAYPFGILGVNFCMLFLKRFFRIDVSDEARAFLEAQKAAADAPIAKDLEVRNTNINGLPIRSIHMLEESNVVITRILQDGHVRLASPTTIVRVGDVVRVVGKARAVAAASLLIGPDSDKDLREIPSNLVSRKIVVTHKKAVGVTIGEIQNFHGVTVARIQRPDVEFVPGSDLKLQYGDQLLIVGEADAIEGVSFELGDSMDTLGRPQILPIFIGVALGVILGSTPIPVPGFAAPIKLGAAGGPLLVALILSHFGSIGKMSWHLPRNSSLVLREIGIVIFLACVGLNSGDSLVKVIIGGPGLTWMGLGLLITVIPPLVVGWYARKHRGMNFMTLCGLLAGSVNSGTALGFADSIKASNASAIAYSAVYPAVMISRILLAQLLVSLFS